MVNGFKFSLSVCSEPLKPSAPVIFSGDIYEIIRKCAKLGYDAVELQLRDAQKLDVPALVACLKENNMGVSGIATGLEYSLNGLSMISNDDAVRSEMRRKLFHDVDLAKILGCPVIIGCVRGNIPSSECPDVYIARFREEMLALADKAASCGVTVVLEAINFYVNNYLCTIRDTCDFIDSLGKDNVGLHIDTHHMAIEETDGLEALRYAGKRIKYVHFAENNRMYPGATNGDYKSVLKILKDVGYQGYVTFEVVPKPTPDICAERSLRNTWKFAESV